jgi:hypothetical protein
VGILIAFGCWFAPVGSVGMARLRPAAAGSATCARKSPQGIESALVKIIEFVRHFPLFRHGQTVDENGKKMGKRLGKGTQQRGEMPQRSPEGSGKHLNW